MTVETAGVEAGGVEERQETKAILLPLLLVLLALEAVVVATRTATAQQQLQLLVNTNNSWHNYRAALNQDGLFISHLKGGSTIASKFFSSFNIYTTPFQFDKGKIFTF